MGGKVYYMLTNFFSDRIFTQPIVPILIIPVNRMNG